MNLSAFYSNGKVYMNCECIEGKAFKNAALWVKCAFLPVICADFGLLQIRYTHLCRIECLLPHISIA